MENCYYEACELVCKTVHKKLKDCINAGISVRIDNDTGNLKIIISRDEYGDYAYIIYDFVRDYIVNGMDIKYLIYEVSNAYKNYILHKVFFSLPHKSHSFL